MRPAGLLLLLALLTACSGNEPEVITAVPVQETAVPVQTTASPAASVSGSSDFGYFAGVLSSAAPVRLSFDRALFLTGREADRAAAARGDQTPVPDDFYIVNDNRLLRTITLSPSVRVTGSLRLNDYAGDRTRVEPAARTVEQLIGFLGTRLGRQTGFHLVYGLGGVVVSLEEQYQP